MQTEMKQFEKIFYLVAFDWSFHYSKKVMSLIMLLFAVTVIAFVTNSCNQLYYRRKVNADLKLIDAF